MSLLLLVSRTGLGGLAAWLALSPVSSVLGQVKINEVMAENDAVPSPDGSYSDWVELYNSSTAPAPLAGYGLTDNSSNPKRWIFPGNTVVAPGGYLLVLLDSARPPSSVLSPVLNAGFAIKGTGDRVELYTPDFQLADSVRFGHQATDRTIGRDPLGTDGFHLCEPTPGAANLVLALGSPGGLRINEWMASPSSGNDWFEIFNPGDRPVALSGLYFTDNNGVPSPVAPLSFVGSGIHAFARFFADNSTDDNEVDFRLGGSGDSISLYSSGGVLIHRVQFGQQTADVSQGYLPDGSGPVQSLHAATPGESNFVPHQGLRVNEVLSHTDPPLEDAVEFYNRTEQPIDVSGWYLSNSRTDLKRFRLPGGMIVPAKGYLVLYEFQFNGPSAQTPFTFNSAHGDQVLLAEASAAGELTGFWVEQAFEAAENGVSFGPVQTSVAGDVKFVALSRTSFGVENPLSLAHFRTGAGQTNPAPRLGPIVINEIMYHPSSPEGGLVDNVRDEYVELVNITSGNVLLFDPAHPENRWRLQDGIRYAFPAGAALAAGSHALVVSFDPVADRVALEAFRAKFQVPADIAIYGPFQDKLGNGGDSVELYKPDRPQGPGRPDEGFVPYLRVDKVNYSDAAPWPSGAAGTGNSLQKKNLASFGNDPVNWEAASPTPGRPSAETVVDSDRDGLPDLWELAYGLDPNHADDALLDADNDHFSNREEYTAGTDPKDAASRLFVGRVRAEPGAPVSIEFLAQAGKSYAVLVRNNLLPSSAWQVLVRTNGHGGPLTVTDPATSARLQRFYRVVTPAVE